MLTSDRMAAIDRNAVALGIPQRLLMESAGNAVAREALAIADPGDRIAIVAGRGNNGGDGFAAARYLENATVTLLGHPDRIATDIARANWDALVAADIDRHIVTDSSAMSPIDADVIVDAILGTGIVGEPRQPAKAAIEAINDAAATVVAVDVPSGVDPDTGERDGPVVHADTVVTFHDEKPGLGVIDATVTVADIGIPPAAERFVGPGDVLPFVGRRSAAHKGEHGRILVIGGGPYVGAPALCAHGALRAGADLVEVAVPAAIADTVASYRPEMIVRPLAGERLEGGHVDYLLEIADRADVVVLGPGLGRDDETMAAVSAILTSLSGVLVVDADAVSMLADHAPSGTVIATPHAGEFADLGYEKPDSLAATEATVESAATAIGATILLKGTYDVISTGERTRINRTGNAGMTTGGTGDVLAGVTAALAVRGEPLEAAAAAAWMTGTAGDRCLADIGYGFTASEVADAVPAAMQIDHQT